MEDEGKRVFCEAQKKKHQNNGSAQNEDFIL